MYIYISTIEYKCLRIHKLIIKELTAVNIYSVRVKLTFVILLYILPPQTQIIAIV